MIKFEELVERLLLQELEFNPFNPSSVDAAIDAAADTKAASNPTSTQTNQQQTSNAEKDQNKTQEQIEEELAKNLIEFFRNKHQPLQTKFNEVFNDYYTSQLGSFPDLLSFEKLVYTVTKNSIRDTENVGSFENDIPSLFPLIDLIAVVKQTETSTKGSPTDKQKVYETAYSSFVKRLDEFKKTNKKTPLEFPSISPWASSVKNRYYEKLGKVDIGKMKIESSELQNKSIRDAVMILLEHRRKSKIKLFKKEINIGSAAKEINSILEEPDNYIEGQISFPDKKINLLYSGATPDLLLSVGKNARLLFTQQVKEKELTKQQITPELYKNFLDNKVSEVLSVRQSEPNTQRRENVGESFQTALHSVLEQLSDASFSTGSYTIRDLQTSSVPEAQQLYKSLKSLADYIRTEAEQIEWSKKISGALSGATQIAKGLSLGVPTMGR